MIRPYNTVFFVGQISIVFEFNGIRLRKFKILYKLKGKKRRLKIISNLENVNEFWLDFFWKLKVVKTNEFWTILLDSIQKVLLLVKSISEILKKFLLSILINSKETFCPPPNLDFEESSKIIKLFKLKFYLIIL